MRSQSTETSEPPALKSLAARRTAVEKLRRVGGDEVAVDEVADLGRVPLDPVAVRGADQRLGSGVSVWAAAEVACGR